MFSISDSSCLFLSLREAIDFCILTVYPTSLLQLLVSFRSPRAILTTYIYCASYPTNSAVFSFPDNLHYHLLSCHYCLVDCSITSSCTSGWQHHSVLWSWFFVFIYSLVKFMSKTPVNSLTLFQTIVLHTC